MNDHKPIPCTTKATRLFALATIATVGLTSIATSSSQPCNFPNIVLCGPEKGIDGDMCAVGNVIGVYQTSSNCELALIHSCYGQDSRCALQSGQCNVWSAFELEVCDVECIGNEPNGQIASVYAGWCGVEGTLGAGRTLNQKCSGGPCDPTQPADIIPPLEPPIPPNPPSSQGLDWPLIANYLVNPGGGGD